MSEYPKSEYGNTRNMCTRQQNEAKYLQSEYSHTHNTSMAGKLIRAQAEQIMGLKERDTAKDQEEFDGHWYKCPTCGKYAGGLKGNFCHVCGQRLKWED